MYLFISILAFNIFLMLANSIDKSEFCDTFPNVKKIFNIGPNVIFNLGNEYITYSTASDNFVDIAVDHIFDASQQVIAKAMASITDRPQFKKANNLLIVVNHMSSDNFQVDSLNYYTYANYRIDGNTVTVIGDEDIEWGLRGKGALNTPFWQSMGQSSGQSVTSLNAFTFCSKHNMFVAHCTAQGGSYFFTQKQITDDSTAKDWINLKTDSDIIPISLFEINAQLYALARDLQGLNVIHKVDVQFDQTEYSITILRESDIPSFLKCQTSTEGPNGVKVTPVKDSKDSKKPEKNVSGFLIAGIIVVIIVICLLLACLVFFTLRKRNQQKKENEAEKSDAESNLSNEESSLKINTMSLGNEELDSKPDSPTDEIADENSLRSE